MYSISSSLIACLLKRAGSSFSDSVTGAAEREAPVA